MKALVTGAAGFVGRHMMATLREKGWEVIGIDNRMVPGIPELIFEDARNVFTGNTFLPELDKQFDLVVHCAYHVGGRVAIDTKPSLLALNLELDALLFDWAVSTEQCAVMYFSSSAAYPVRLQEAGSLVFLAEHMIDLDNVRQPDARYGWAKLTGEQLAVAAAQQGLRVHTLRPFSGYGEDQDMCYPFPAIVSRVLKGDLSVWGPPGQIRDWIHIDDVVNGALAVYEADYRKPVNLCTGVGTEFGDLVVQVAKANGVKIKHGMVSYQPDQPTGVMVRVGNPYRMHDFYEPKITIEDGISMAVAVMNG